MIKSSKIEYYDNEVLLEGFYAVDDTDNNKKPAVLVVHDWSGRNEFAENKAKRLAELGYVGFAVDMYGQGKIGNSTEEKMSLMKPLVENRAVLLQRITKAFDFVKTLKWVDTTRIGVIGFCFGGLCALDLARSGADVSGIVSFHGILNAPEQQQKAQIKAKILVLHGHDDPMVQPAQVLAFENEMTAAKADWQVHVYGNTKHAFTNPLAHDEQMGTVYSRLAEKRSMIAMESFFAEIF